MTDLKFLGWSDHFSIQRIDFEREGFETARVISEHKERYRIKTLQGEYDAEITGKLRYEAIDRTGFPAVGDWVGVSLFDNMAIIHAVYPRKTILQRKAVGHVGEIQVIASNVDVAFIMQSLDNDFNLNRLDRYITVAKSGGVEPVILLSKTDLVSPEELLTLITQVKLRQKETELIAFSNANGEGISTIEQNLKEGKTYCILGSSGVGKSSLINYLLGNEYLKTNRISDATSKGKHTTTHRELVFLRTGAILIDTPGMREMGITGSADDLTKSFNRVEPLLGKCKYVDCTHTVEEGCALLAAVENGKLEISEYDNYLKLLRESTYFNSSLAEKRKRDKKFGRMIKQVIKHKKNNKY